MITIVVANDPVGKMSVQDLILKLFNDIDSPANVMLHKIIWDHEHK
jgi:hypothetical protein